MSDETTFVILGSCVTRDAFELIGDRPWKLIKYMARTSLGSLFAPGTKSITPDYSVYTSPFRRRMVEEDITKTGVEWLATASFDVLIYDMIDERFDLAKFPDGGICTISAEFEELGQDEESYVRVPQDSEEFWDRWEDGWTQLIEHLDQRGIRDRLVVHDAPWAQRIRGSDDDRFNRPYVRSANAWLAKAMERVRRDLPPGQIVRVPEARHEVDPEHRWGLTPFHYVPEYYEALNRRIAASGPVIESCVRASPPCSSPRDDDFIEIESFLTEENTVSDGWTRVTCQLPVGLSQEILAKFSGVGKPLVCFLPSAQAPASVSNPVFFRRTWAEAMSDCNVLVLSEAALHAHPELVGGWMVHAGTDLAGAVAEQVARIAAKWSVPSERVIFYGSSMGGFEALKLAALMKSSHAIAEIPQLDLRQYQDPVAREQLSTILLGSDLDELPEDLVPQVSIVEFFRAIDSFPSIHFLTNVDDPGYSQVVEIPRQLQGVGDGTCGPVHTEVCRDVSGHLPLPRQVVMEAINRRLCAIGLEDPSLYRSNFVPVDMSGSIPLSEPIRVALRPSGRSISVDVTTAGLEVTSSRAALLTFDLRAQGDKKLEDILSSRTDIVRSGVAGLGWFRYLPTGPGMVSEHVDLDLPPEVSCRGLAIHRWGSDIEPPVVRRLRVTVTPA